MIKFLKYEYTSWCLCMGTAFFQVEGKQYLISGWESGGYCDWESESIDVVTGPWSIDLRYLPKAIRKYRDEIIKIFNENVPWGCCGGCI